MATALGGVHAALIAMFAPGGRYRQEGPDESGLPG